MRSTRYGTPWLALHAIGWAVLVAYLVLSPIPLTSDVENYWLLDTADPYRNRWGSADAFVYSPAFGQFVYPFTFLPFEAFYRLLMTINLVCLAWLLGPVFGALVLAVPFVQSELTTGQIHLPLTVMCVLLVRHPASWAFGVLTKVTPGVSLLWYVGRREWRRAAVATGVTLAIVAVSVVTWPSAWADWIDLLLESSTRNIENFVVNEYPAIYRMPIAAGLLVMAAWRNRPAAIPILVCYSLPAIWFGALVMLAGVPRLAQWLKPAMWPR